MSKTVIHRVYILVYSIVLWTAVLYQVFSNCKLLELALHQGRDFGMQTFRIMNVRTILAGRNGTDISELNDIERFKMYITSCFQTLQNWNNVWLEQVFNGYFEIDQWLIRITWSETTTTDMYEHKSKQKSVSKVKWCGPNI